MNESNNDMASYLSYRPRRVPEFECSLLVTSINISVEFIYDVVTGLSVDAVHG